jgi:hypothetical protein
MEWQAREADHSPLSGAEFKNGGAIPAVPHTSSWHTCLINLAQGQVYLLHQVKLLYYPLKSVNTLLLYSYLAQFIPL